MLSITEKIITYLSSIIPNCYLLVTVISALPLIELKGAILLGISKGLNPFAVLALSYLGSSSIAPLILLLLRPILNLVKKIPILKKLAERAEARIGAKAVRITQKNAGKSTRNMSGNLLGALFLFVALPLPMTGVYTGAAIACFLDADYLKSLAAILGGNLVAGLIVLAIALFFEPWTNLIFAIFLIAVLLALTVAVTIAAVKRCMKVKALH